ncbi:MAG TPA: DUF2244 domain-containing protein [Pinirhizobacter sp.]|uniref:DUF2244 domain-containing protein n=1 Tax=Pinirhizobacter sp. TaxID=2950432 RepID=UPI002BA015C8|nr:DUF2244 domain-containing protein [Pinirhizobacter sp.]HMH68332.1 DUF2244 domain-containing protein [Pinirhizobacter sp.]
MVVLRPAITGLPRVVWLRPNRALSRRGLHRLSWSLAALSISVAWICAWQGNVFAPVFALLESVAVASLLSLAWRAGGHGERIVVEGDKLEVQWLPGRRRASFQPYWVRVRLLPGNGRQRLVLKSHGREIEIGAFLGEEEKVEASRKLMVLLAEINDQPRR